MIPNGRKSSTHQYDDEPCVCDVYSDIKRTVAEVGCGDDFAAVAALPDRWVPKHGGPILANYLEQRKKQHEDKLKELMDKTAIINNATDVKIRSLAELLLSHIKQNQKDIECIVEHSPTGEVPISAEDRNECLKKVSQLYTQRVDDIARFKLEALALERERADGLKNLLRDQFQKLIAIGQQTPKDLLHDFDERAYEINQQLMSNSRAYSELEAQLRAQADESVIYGRSTLNQLCLGVSVTRSRSAVLRTRDERHSSIRRSLSVVVERTPEAAEIPIKRILGEADEFDECMKHLVQAYRTAILRIFTGISGKLSDLQKDLRTHCFLEQVSSKYEVKDIERMIDRAMRRLSSSVNKAPSQGLIDMARGDTLNMQRSLIALGARFRDTYSILHDAGHLWDAHMIRSALAQKLTIVAVEDLLTNYDAIQLANEINFNVALEQLRTMSDQDKLHQHHDYIKNMLNNIADLYLQHSEKELGRLEEFMNLPPAMANTLLAECDCFLEKYPRSPIRSNSNISQTSAISRLGSNVYNSSLPRAILQTELQEIALQNWRNGFLESFEGNISLVSEELRRQARLWVEERASALHMRYSLKLVSHSIRSERVKAAHDIRLNELRFHEQRLNSHLDAVYNLVERLPAQASESLSLDAPELYPVCRWVNTIKSEIDTLLLEDPDPERKRLKMSSYAPRLSKYRRLFEESLDMVLDIFKKQVEYRLQEARVSNVRFISQIKMFGEGGRYSAHEALRSAAALVKAADALESCSVKTLDAMQHRRGHLLSLADQLIQPVQKVIDETLKSGGKPAQEKRKPPPGKKK